MSYLKNVFLPVFALLSFGFGGARAQNQTVTRDSVKKLHELAIADAYSEPDRAFEYAAASLELSQANGFKKEEQRSYYCYGLIYYYKGYYVISNDYYRLIIGSRESDAEQKSAAWNNMGINFETLNLLDSALYAYQESMKLDKSLGDLKSENMVRINTGMLYFKLRRMSKAFGDTKKALDYFTGTKDSSNLALCYLNLGLYYAVTGKTDSAWINNNKSEEIYGLLGDYPNLILAYINEIDLWSGKKNTARAYETYQKAKQALTRIESPYHTAAVHGIGSQVYALAGQYDSAIAHSYLAVNAYNEMGIPERSKIEYFSLAKIYAEIGEKDKFVRTIDKYDSLSETLRTTSLNNRLAEMEVKYKLDSKNKEIKTGQALLKEQQKLIIVISVCTLILLIGLVKTYSLYTKVKTANRSLYLKNRELMETVPAAVPEAVSEETKTEENGLLARFQRVLTEKQLFKNAELNLKSASMELGTNEKYLSQAINSGGIDNFNTYINRFRVNEARRIIMDGRHNDISIEELGMMVGFSNRHTFSRAFTQETGISPSVFRKIHLTDSVLRS